MSDPSKLIVALGNPGNQYSATRHNIGWMVMEELYCFSKLNWKEKFKGTYAQISENGEKIYFLMPQTFMNLSGESVAQLAKFFKIEIENIMVIHDELDLPFGTLALKNGGGLSGHNGLKSMKQCLGKDTFLRLRMGIGRPTRGSVSDHVLSNFSSDENITLERFVDGGCDAIELFIKQGFEKAASSFSKKSYL